MACWKCQGKVADPSGFSRNSLGASCHLNLAIRRARVLSSGSPPTSVGHAKKSYSTTP